MPLTLPQSASRTADPSRPTSAEPRGDHPLSRAVYPDGRIGWLATGRGAARAVLGDARFHRRFGPARATAPVSTAGSASLGAEPTWGSGTASPPRASSAPLSAERVAAYVAECLDAMARKGSPADLVDAFARPVAAMAAVDRHRDLVPAPEFGAPTSSPTEPDAIADLLALGAFALLREPAQSAAWRADAGLTEAAAARLLRYLDVIQYTVHTAAADVTVAGRLVRAGESVTVSIQAAELALEPLRGGGRHRPVTEPTAPGLDRETATVLLRTALPPLLRRFPGLALAVPPGEVPARGDGPGPRRLPVRW